MSSLVGVADGLVLIEVQPGLSVAVDTDDMVAFDAAPTEEYRERMEWSEPGATELDPAWLELAEAAAATSSGGEIAETEAPAATPPAEVREAARIAVTEFSDYLTPKETAFGKIIASGRPLDEKSVHRMNRFFFTYSGPTDVPIYQLHGGDAGKQWANDSANALVASAPRTATKHYTHVDDASRVFAHVHDVVFETWDGAQWSVTYPDPSTLRPISDDDATTRAEALTASARRERAERRREYERELAARAIPKIDWTTIDSVFALDLGRADRAQKQVRDGGGKFAKVGSRITAGDGKAGTVTGVNDDETVNVRMGGDEPDRRVAAAEVKVATPKAQLPRALPLVTDVKQLLADYAAKIAEPPLPETFADVSTAPGSPETPAPAAPTVETAPTTTNEQPTPLHIAIVDEIDTQAVLELVQITPAGEGQELAASVRENGTWRPAPEILRDLQGGTPPPVVELDPETYETVVQQVDSFVPEGEGDQADTTQAPAPAAEAPPAPVAAGGGDYRWFDLETAWMKELADGPGDGDAEELREYWTTGEGGAKIRWGTDGDFTRCDRQLRKYLGARSKGYCALRHREMNGEWPGASREKKSMAATFGLVASAADDPALERFTAETVDEVADGGARFKISVLAPEGVESGDGRTFAADALTIRNLPLPLLWQRESSTGHDGSVIVGRIDSADRIEGGIGNAYGVFDTSPEAKEAERLVRDKFLRGISVDLDGFEADVVQQASEGEAIAADRINITSARVMAATLVAKPAFQECVIELMEDNGDWTEATDDAEALMASALVAAAAPLEPPIEWFENPNLEGPTHLTVTDDGRVFGHVAAWDVDHIGMPFGTRAPHSPSGYAYFRTGVVRTAEGSDVPVGQLTLAGGHAPLSADASSAVKHYDDTASAVADVAAGEDRYGIWVAGALRPSVGPEQVRALRASSPSGDWRPINGQLELVAVCQVNVPGFPVARARVASGAVTALVAAGARPLAELRETPMQHFELRIAALEAAEAARLAEKFMVLRKRVEPVRNERQLALTAAAEAAKAKVDAIRNAKRAALTAALEQQRARLAAAGLTVGPKFEEEHHPRWDKGSPDGRGGKFREVVARLNDIANDASDSQVRAAAEKAADEVGRAVDLEDEGDNSAAEQAAERALDNMSDAVKSKLNEVQQELLNVARETARGNAPGSSKSPVDDALDEVVEEVIDETGERAQKLVDPTDQLQQELEAWVTGHGFDDPRAIATYLRQRLLEMLQGARS